MRFDAGLQPERTALSWNRTALSIVVGGALTLRVAPPAFGSWGIVMAILVIVGGAGLGVVAHRRSLRTESVLLTRNGWLPDGRLLLVMAALLSLAAALLTVVVIQAALAG